MTSKFINICGYGWSGSSAVVDLLREFENYGSPSIEFGLIREPHGLVDLEAFLVDNWHFVRHDVAIKDFLNYCSIVGRPPSNIGRWGGGLSKELEVDFLGASKMFVDELTLFKYQGGSAVFEYGLSSYSRFVAKIFRRLYLIKNSREMRIARPSKDEFLVACQQYITALFSQYTARHGYKSIVLDQAIPSTSLEKASKYFDEIKTIIVDRDPRDIYVDMIDHNSLLGPSLKSQENADNYILWHKELRRMSTENRAYCENGSNVLRIKFEDLVFNYSTSLERIKSFLGGNINHSKIGAHFKAELSKRNIGKWKSFEDKNVMNRILAALPNDCYLESQ